MNGGRRQNAAGDGANGKTKMVLHFIADILDYYKGG